MNATTSRPGWPNPSPWKKHWHLLEDVVFLNHGSFGACPRAVLETQTRLRIEMEEGPVQFLARQYDGRLDHARAALASFIGANPGNLVFVNNSTSGVNAVTRSLKFKPGDEILTTSLDYNACRNVLAETARESGATLVVAEIPFPLDHEDQVVDAILAAVTPKTRLAMIDHVTSNTGMILPLERIIRELEARGVESLVDGAHGAGMLPLDLEKLGATYYTGNLHKWVCAPKGAAFLWVRPDKQEAIQPVTISHGNNRPRPDHSPFQTRFDWPGTQDPSAWLVVPELLQWLGSFLPGGWEEFRTNRRAAVLDARRILCERLNLAAPCPESMIGTMATLPMPRNLACLTGSESADPVYRRLFDEFGIELHVIHIGGTRWFRISSHLHNSPDEYRYLADVLEQLAAGE